MHVDPIMMMTLGHRRVEKRTEKPHVTAPGLGLEDKGHPYHVLSLVDSNPEIS